MFFVLVLASSSAWTVAGNVAAVVLALVAILGGLLAVRQLRAQASYARMQSSDLVDRRWSSRLQNAENNLTAFIGTNERPAPRDVIDDSTEHIIASYYREAALLPGLEVARTSRVVPYVLLALSPRLKALAPRAPRTEREYRQLLKRRCEVIFPLIDQLRSVDASVTGSIYTRIFAVVEGYVNALNEIVEMMQRKDADPQWLLAKLHFPILREVHVLEPLILWKSAHSDNGRWGLRLVSLGAAARQYHWKNRLHCSYNVSFVSFRGRREFENADYGPIIAGRHRVWLPWVVERKLFMRAVNNSLGRRAQKRQAKLVKDIATFKVSPEEPATNDTRGEEETAQSSHSPLHQGISSLLHSLPESANRVAVTDWLKEWITSPAMERLARASGWTVPATGWSGGLDTLVALSGEWDFRSGAERVGLTSQPASVHGKVLDEDLIRTCAWELGLVGGMRISGKYDAVVVLSGLAAATMKRFKFGLSVAEAHSIPQLVVLTANRQLSPSEDQQLEELGLMGCRLESDVAIEVVRAHIEQYGNIARVWSRSETASNQLSSEMDLAEYDLRTTGFEANVSASPAITVMSAPSKDPSHRRATTSDQLEFFDQRWRLGPSDRLLFVTTEHYVVAQHLQSLKVLCLKRHCAATTAAVEWEPSGPYRGRAYLQEIRAALTEAKRLHDALADA